MDLKSQLKLIEKQLNKKIRETLRNEVKDTVVKTMQKHIQEDVYDAYTPQSYERTYQLISEDNIISNTLDDNTLLTYNDRRDGDTYIPKIIEAGKGYYNENLDRRIGARPFIKNTKEDLESSGKAVDAMKDGLKKRGIKVE